MAEELPELQENISPSGGGGPQNFINQIMSDPKKRLIAIISAAVLVILVTVLIVVFSGKKDENRGKLVTLVQELDQARAFEVVAKLKTVNIESKVQPGEKPGEYIVQVYENAIETAYLNLSRTNLLEDEGYGLFDQSDWAASDYDKRIKLLRAINGDLSKIVSRMDGMRSAIVRVNLPEQQLFTEFQASPTATVQIELINEGDELSKSQVKSIVNVLRGYVPNLEKDKISIVDTQGNNYSTFKEEDETTTDDFIDELEKVNKTIRSRIEKYLDAVLGDEKYKVSVSASISREKIQKQQTLYTEGAVGSRQKDVQYLNSGAGRVGPVTGKNFQQEASSETLMPSFEQQSVTYLPGRVTNVTVALAVDTSVPAMISLKQLQESVAAIVGPNALPEHIKLTVVDLSKGAGETAPNLQDAVKSSGGGIFGLFKSNGVFKFLALIGTILGILVIGILGLNFLNSASSQKVTQTIDSNLGDDFDQVLNEDQMAAGAGEAVSDYGEKQAIDQQEMLLKEMLNSQQAETVSVKAGAAKSHSEQEFAGAEQQDAEFKNLLNGFQSVAHHKPDLLAKKIQVWLEDE